MKLGIIIVNYNVRYFLEQCLYSVRKAAAKIDTQIWVVDNHSVDGSANMVAEKFPDVRLIHNKENVGFSKANNQAIRQCNAEYILLLNPDTVVEEDTFLKVIQFMDNHTDAGGLGVRMIDGKGRFLPESKRGLPSPRVAFYKMFGLSYLFPESKMFGEYHLGYLPEFEINEVDVLSGAFMLLRSSVLSITGLLDETYFMYAEDVDLSYQIKKAGYKNYYFPDTTIIHYKGESTKKGTLNYVFMFYRAMAQFVEKNFSAKYAWQFRWFINIAIWIRASFTLIGRIIKTLLRPVTDFLLLGTFLYYFRNIYEDVIREGELQLPESFVTVNIPLYAATFVLAGALNDIYGKHTSVIRIFRALLTGAIILSVFYAFLNEEFRSSRLMILISLVAAGFIFTLTRFFDVRLRRKKGEKLQGNISRCLIIGNAVEAERVNNLLNKTAAPLTVTGYIAKKNEPKSFVPYLGSPDDIKEITSLYQINELIFCSKDFSVTEIMHIMNQLSYMELEYRMVPEDGLFVIGSHHRNQSGDYYTLDMKPDVLRKNTKLTKRFFDLSFVFLLLFFFPFLLFIVKKPVQFLINIWNVFIGKKTWVGYCNDKESAHLPPLKPGVIDTCAGMENREQLNGFRYKLNLMYAVDYTIENDIRLIYKGLKDLGN